MIECLLPKHLHTVTAPDFELRVALFILACSLNFVFPTSSSGNLGYDNTIAETINGLYKAEVIHRQS